MGAATQIYLAVGATDMRKGFEGLYGLVRDRLQCQPLSGHVFLFCNAQRNRLKLLVWDGSGLCIFQKRLAKGTFAKLWRDDGQVMRLTASELALFIEGCALVGKKMLSPPALTRNDLAMPIRV